MSGSGLKSTPQVQPQSQSQMHTQQQQNQFDKVCPYLQYGRCTSGVRCRYLHPSPNNEPKSQSQSQSQSQLNSQSQGNLQNINEEQLNLQQYMDMLQQQQQEASEKMRLLKLKAEQERLFKLQQQKPKQMKKRVEIIIKCEDVEESNTNDFDVNPAISITYEMCNDSDIKDLMQDLLSEIGIILKEFDDSNDTNEEKKDNSNNNNNNSNNNKNNINNINNIILSNKASEMLQYFKKMKIQPMFEDEVYYSDDPDENNDDEYEHPDNGYVPTYNSYS